MTCDAKVVGSKAAGRSGRSISRTIRFTTHLPIQIPIVVERDT